MFNAATSPPRVASLIMLAGLSVLSLNMFLPSLSNMAETFQVDYAVASLAIAGYLAMTAVLQLVIGPLSDRYGRRPVLLAGLLIFSVASFGCVLATNIWAFLAFRLAQGVIISGWVISMAVIRDTSEPREAASLIGYVTMAMAIAPMLGPMVGGVFDELFGWRSSFVFYAVAGTAMLVICWADVGETNTSPSETLASQIQSYPELFSSRRFWGYALCMAFSTGSFYAFLAGVPLVAETIFKLSPSSLGFYMGTITSGFMVGSFLSGRYSRRFALTTIVLAGRVVACTGLIVGLAFLFAGAIHVATLFGAVILVGLGNGLTTPGCSAGVLSVRPKLAGSASGLAGALSVGGGATLSSITSVMLTEGDAALTLLGMMLFCSVMGLLATLYVMRIDRSEGRKR
ncbi:MAG: multidrug effflux MFS transporter [Alphaproteobacteria bacterium]|nr:multidrug effflux MFS transporter [Alphaproteobacteria bacterium]